MSFALCHLSVVPVRHSPSNRSEQVTQILFGEIVELIEKRGKLWTRVRCTWDNCIGWVQTLQITPITLTEKELFSHSFAYCLDLFQPLMCEERAMPVTIGSRLPDFDGLKFTFNGKTYLYSGQAVFPENLEAKPAILLKIAMRYQFAPFQWGGRSPLGIDASGFVQAVFQLVGIKLHRDAGEQVYQGQGVDFIEQALPGDLAFFENQAGNIRHVGIILPGRQIIHVAEQVRIDKLDHYGVFHAEKRTYTHRLRVIRRLLNPERQAGWEPKTEMTKTSSQVSLFN